LNKQQKKWNEEVYRRLNIPAWHLAGVTGNNINIAVIGYGACLIHKKPYIVPVNDIRGGSYHDGDEIIHEVAPGAKIYSLNMKDKGGWSFQRCLEWVVANKPDIVCMSFVLSNWDAELEELSRQAYENGTILISSTGNNGSGVRYPAKSQRWIGVGAYDEKRSTRAGYSNYGEGLTCMGYTDLVVEAQEGYYIPISHTSGATQAVAGIAALLKEQQNITPGEFLKLIAGDKIWEPEIGYGLFVLPREIPEKEETQVNNPEYIIIHHSATREGNAEAFRNHHKNVNGWRDIGYHYIIGNGSQSGDGQVEKGRAENESGAHCNVDRMNYRSIGICLVGNFQEQRPTAAQMESLRRLCRDIMGRYKIPSSKILGHGEVKGAATACPGRNFDMNTFCKQLEEKKMDYKGHWAESSIEKVKQEGLMSGFPDGSFKPDEPVTRAQLATVIAKLIERK